MTTILPAERTPWDVLGKDVGQAIQGVLPGAIQQGYNRGQLQRSLDDIKQLANDPNASPLDIALGTMRAGAGIPGSERYMASILPEIMKLAAARKAQGVALPGEQPGMASPNAPTMQPSPQMGGGEEPENPFFPNNVNPEQGPGNIPQPETKGQKVPLLDQDGRIKEAKRLAQHLTDNGIPTEPKDALQMVDAEEEKKKLYNERVDQDLYNRTKAQQTYGSRAVEQLEKVYPGATPEMQAIFAKKGEEAAAKNISEADIDRHLAVEAKNFKNLVSGVKNAISAPRLQNSLGRRFLGTYSDAKQASNDLRAELKPILDLGLYDTARNLVTDLGYYPEEREMVINPMSEKSQTLMNRAPQLGKKQISLIHETPQSLYPQGIQNVKSVLKELKEADPNFSLLLPRKYLEDKGYDWRLYKDALNELEAEGFELTEDQRNQRKSLETPPLNNLERVLHNIHIIGR